MSKHHVHIIQAIQNNDSDVALQLLYKQSLGKVIKIVKKYKGNKEDGEDVFQDVVIILFKLVRENKLKENTNFDALVYTIAKNNWFRKLQRSKKIGLYDNLSGFNTMEDDYNVEQQLMHEEKNKFLAKAFSLLSENCQKIISFIYFEKLSLQDVSEKIGLKNADVAKAMHYKCKKKLLTIINGDETLSKVLNK